MTGTFTAYPPLKAFVFHYLFLQKWDPDLKVLRIAKECQGEKVYLYWNVLAG